MNFGMELRCCADALLGGYVGEAKTGKVKGNRAKSGLGKRAEVAHEHVRRAPERCTV